MPLTPNVIVCQMANHDVTSLIRNDHNWDLSNIKIIWVHLLPVSYAYN